MSIRWVAIRPDNREGTSCLKEPRTPVSGAFSPVWDGTGLIQRVQVPKSRIQRLAILTLDFGPRGFGLTLGRDTSFHPENAQRFSRDAKHPIADPPRRIGSRGSGEEGKNGTRNAKFSEPITDSDLAAAKCRIRTDVEMENAMTESATPRIVTRDEWERARAELLVREKAHTHAGDELAAARRRLPMTRMEPVKVVGPDGPVPLHDVFEGRRMLIVYHFMWKKGATSPPAM